MPRSAARVVDYETRVGDLHDLRAFSLACDLRSLTSVARTTGESKATVSRRITRLESALGVTLLRRSTRGIVVTDEGAAYRLQVGEVLERLGDANAAAVHGGRATPRASCGSRWRRAWATRWRRSSPASPIGTRRCPWW